MPECPLNLEVLIWYHQESSSTEKSMKQVGTAFEGAFQNAFEETQSPQNLSRSFSIRKLASNGQQASLMRVQP